MKTKMLRWIAPAVLSLALAACSDDDAPSDPAGTVTLNSDAKVNGDCDQDGTISQADAAILMQFLVHLVDELPVQGA